jgi:hypothetical protein
MHHAVQPDDARSRIAEQGKFLSQLLPQVARRCRRIDADADQLNAERIEVGFMLRELAELAGAERSPISAIKNQQDALAAHGSEMKRLAVLVGESEVRRLLAFGGGRLRRRKHLAAHRCGTREYCREQETLAYVVQGLWIMSNRNSRRKPDIVTFVDAWLVAA